MNARHSHDSNQWYTPSEYVEAARTVLRGIDLDPASHEEAQMGIRAAYYYTEHDNGLEQDWTGRIFLNPPGGLVVEFWEKLLRSDVSAAIWIGYSLEQLQTLQSSGYPSPIEYPICIPSRRIAFVESSSKQLTRMAKLRLQGKDPNAKSSPTHANYITYIGPETGLFLEVFSRFGAVRL